jgi:hypothetical protein
MSDVILLLLSGMRPLVNEHLLKLVEHIRVEVTQSHLHITLHANTHAEQCQQ